MRNDNNVRTDPFTRTPGVAGKAFINMHYAERIVADFSDEEASKFVYKIVGLRGSGKSVEYGKVLNEFRSKKEWLVYSLSAAGNPTETLIAKLSAEKFVDSSDRSTSISGSVEAGSDIKLVRGSAGITVTESISKNKDYYSQEATLDEMLLQAKDKGYKILIGIDDISKTDEIVKFLSIIGKHFVDGDASIYLLCTGLSKNIEDFSREPNLTFFKRSDAIEISALSRFEVAYKYEELLHVTKEKAIEMAKTVKGYAYAYQVLGSLSFTRTDETEEEILQKFEMILFQDSYDLIWRSLSPAEKEFVKIIFATSGKVKEIKARMQNEQNYPVLRDRLAKKHILNTSERGLLSVDLPRFKEYVFQWGE